jgi:hypothetical protein
VSARGDGQTLPDVKDLSPLRQGWLLVDEITPVLVIKNRRFFQGKSGWTNISGSATNVYAKRVLSWGVRIIGTANDWRERSAALDPESRRWLCANSIVADVKRPLWLLPGKKSERVSGSYRFTVERACYVRGCVCIRSQ